MSNLTLLIDGDILAYKAAATVERSVNWGEGCWTVHSFEEEGITSLENQVATLQTAYPGADTIFALTDGTNFRTKILPSYKGNRKAVRRPLILPFMRTHMLDNYRTYLRPGLEGDDCLGILATSKTIIPGDKVIASIDKDMRCIPGKFWDFGRGIHYDISEAEADRFHLYQTLIGDTTDGYTGLPGCGPKKAALLLETKGATWSTVRDAYIKAGLTEEDALIQARVARILRVQDFCFDTKRPKLWTPKPELVH